MKGDRLPSLAKIVAAAVFSQVTVTRYGKADTIAVHAFTCLWYSVTGTAPSPSSSFGTIQNRL
jgi:hypothetical protein